MPNSVDLLSGAINRILTGAGGWGVPYLFNNDEVGVWYDPSDRKTMFQNSNGTTLVSVGDPVGYIADKSGNGLNAIQATAAARPILVQSDDGDYILQNDEVDDALTVTFPDMGTDCTVAFVTQSEVRLDEGVTLNGSYTLPQIDILGFVAIDRALNVGEQINLILYLASKATGVSYGASIDRLDLIAVNAVDVFVYDTSKDSDGGAWRTGALAQASSWYNETLNTATRGSRREFPAVAVIVAESNKVTIYDGDDPSLPMWMTIPRVNTATGVSFWYYSALTDASCVFAANGKIAIGISEDTTNGGLRVLDFVADKAEKYLTTPSFAGYFVPLTSVKEATPTLISPSSWPSLVNRDVNDVAMTVLPDAPIDPATGLPVPTIAVATDGGVSVITDSGAVYDSALTLTFGRVAFDGQGGVWAARSTSTYILIYGSVSDYISGDGWGDIVARGDTSTAGGFDLLSSGTSGVLVADNTLALSGTASVQNSKAGVSLRQLDYADQSKGMSALLTSTYNTGWMNGDIKGAFLADTDDTDLVGGTDNDRSVNNNPLTVNGTVTRTPVATGAELVAYSGFSASNYLEQPYNPDLDFGTGDFCVMGWVKTVSTGQQTIISRDNTKLEVYVNANGIAFAIGGTGRQGTIPIANTGWRFFTVFRSSGVGYTYVDGKLDGSVSATGSVDVTETLRVGLRQTSITPFLGGSLALLRISATAPTADQILKIYNDEKVLFQENAACTLYGASDAVTALAHDPDTDLLHVGTSAGRSVFRGLERISHRPTTVSTAISATGGLIVAK